MNISRALKVLGLCCLLITEHAIAETATTSPTAVATFAGGCFWCMEPPFDKLDGVISTTSGYTGGHVENPDYKQVSGGGTGHTEAIQVVYDPEKIHYEKLLDIFWRNIDPLDGGGQFCDRGSQYRSEVFYHNAEQQTLAVQSKQKMQDGAFKQYGKPIATEITAASVFYPAEDYHQDYYKKNPLRYKYYRNGCGRDKVLNKYWKKDDKKS